MIMLTLSDIQKIAKKEKAVIGIGDEDQGGSVERSCEIAKEKGFAETEIFHDHGKMINALKSGKIEGAVRGTFSARQILSELKSQFGLERIQRIALMAMDDEKLVLLAPVGIDEGQSLKEKKELAVYGRELLSIMGEDVLLGVLSGGRLEDLGRNPQVDESLQLGKILAKETQDIGIPSTHFGILLEDALSSSNFIMAPDGISGNLIFRSLYFFGGVKALGAPVSNLPRVFVDTSRSKSDFSDSIALASALCKLYCPTKL
jgi:putative methanogen marker protein 4